MRFFKRFDLFNMKESNEKTKVFILYKKKANKVRSVNWKFSNESKSFENDDWRALIIAEKRSRKFHLSRMKYDHWLISKFSTISQNSRIISKLWRSTLWMNLIGDGLSTIYKLRRKRRKEKKNEKWREYLSLRMQKARSALDVLHEVLCLSQSKQSSFRNSFIISRKSHHFSMRRETSMTRAFDDASSR